MTGEALRARFMARVSPEPMSGCWLWTGAPCSVGYGTFHVAPGVQERSHRAAWILFRGPIPRGALVCHRCDNKGCVNFESHLYLGNKSTNAIDAVTRGQLRLHQSRPWDHRLRKLSAAAVLELRQRARDGERKEDLAVEFGVSPSYAYRIANGTYGGGVP